MLSTEPSGGSLLELRILGPLEIRIDGQLLDMSAPRLRAVLGALLLSPGQTVSTRHLAESVWEDNLPADPANQVAACISLLRRMFRQGGVSQELLVTRRPGYKLMTGAGVRIDAVVFRDLQEEALASREADDPRRALALLKSALGLWRGPVLSGMECRAWQPEIRRLEEEYIALRERCSDVQLGLGLHEDVVTELSVFIEQYPLLERPRAQLMVALFRSGRQADALQVYRDTAELLREELGVLPGKDLQQTLESMLQGTANTPTAKASSHIRTSVSSAGSVTGPSGTPCQLPGDLAEFVGRREEIDVLRSVIVPGGGSVPVAVIVGPGGTGKTVLAVHTAHQLRQTFKDGQLYVNLRGMDSDPVSAEEALARFLRELGLSGAAIPDSLDERAALFRSLVAGRRMLLVLDNAGDARQVRPLLPGADTCGVLVTSRIRLTTVPNAHVLELDVLDRDQAHVLLGQMVGEERVEAEPDVARELVEYCGRLPLAVRIVGAKLASKPHWSLRKAASRLADEQRRLDELAHEGLEVRSSLELSHQGLSPQARRLFRRLALLAAPDFAEWICAPLLSTSVREAEDLLEELLHARLVDVVTPMGSPQARYRMHDLVRLFASECLTETEPAMERTAALQRVAATTLALVDLAHREVCGGDFTVVHSVGPRPSVSEDVIRLAADDPLDWYEADRSTISALCTQAAQHDEDEIAWDMAATSRCLFSVRFHFDDWQHTHEVALAAVQRHGNKRGEATMLLGLGDLNLTRRLYDRAVPLLERSRELFLEIGDRHGYALALRKAACADRVQGRTAHALERWQECLPILREAADLEAQTQVHRWMAQTLIEVGRGDEAEVSLRAAEQMAESFNGRSAAQVHLAQADLRLARGELAQAATAYETSLQATSRLGDLSGRCAALLGLGTVDVRQQRITQAQERLVQARDLARSIQDPLLEVEVLLSLAAAHEAEGSRGKAVALLNEGEELCRRMGAVHREERFTAALAGLKGPARSGG